MTRPGILVPSRAEHSAVTACGHSSLCLVTCAAARTYLCMEADVQLNIILAAVPEVLGKVCSDAPLCVGVRSSWCGRQAGVEVVFDAPGYSTSDCCHAGTPCWSTTCFMPAVMATCCWRWDWDPYSTTITTPTLTTVSMPCSRRGRQTVQLVLKWRFALPSTSTYLSDGVMAVR